MKEQIGSGLWRPGDLLPSEPELARRFGVSRVVVRQALAILEDDRQILRVRGRGTFVAEPKIDYRAGGLSRLLELQQKLDAWDRLYNEEVNELRKELSLLTANYMREYQAQRQTVQPRRQRRTERPPWETS